MNFKEWLQLNESFELPFKVYKDILDFAVESHKKHLEKPRTKIEPKVFDLDLSGTKYDFLSIFKPSVKVSMRPSSALQGSAGWFYDKIDTVGWTDTTDEIRSKYGNIPMLRGNVDLAIYEPTYYSNTIEHELLHFMQELIKEYAIYKKRINQPDVSELFNFIRRYKITNNEKYQSIRNNPSFSHEIELPEKPWELLHMGPKQFFKAAASDIKFKKTPEMMGGLPPRSLVKRIMKDRGLNISGKKDVKRTKHGQRPIEYYTNLRSIIKVLPIWYINKYKLENPDIKKLAADVNLKKKYLDYVMTWDNYISNKINAVKNVDYDLYKIYMNTIANKFLLDDSIFDNEANAFDADDAVNQFKLDLENKKKKKTKGPSPLEGTRFTEKDFEDDFRIDLEDVASSWSDFSDMDENRQATEEFRKIIGGRIEKDYRGEPRFLNFKLNYDKIKNIFKKLAKISKVGGYHGDNFLRMSRYFAHEIADGLAYRKGPTGDELLDMFFK